MELQSSAGPARLPLHEIHAQEGAVFRESDGWLLPAYFSDPIAENLAVRNNAGIIDLSQRRYMKIAGPDRASFLQGIITNDLSNIKSGEGLHSAVLTVKGHIIADFILLAFEENFLLQTEPLVAEKLSTTLKRYKIREKVTIERLDDLGTIGVQGPKSTRIIKTMTEGALPDIKTYHHARINLETDPITICRHSMTGEDGYELTLPQNALKTVWERLLEVGEEFGLRRIGHEADESLRIEAGLPRSGVDLTEENIPLEIENEDMISFTKGCYVGQEVIARLKFLGQANKHLRGLLFGEATTLASNSRVLENGKEIGKVTSTAYSPALRHPIALAYVRREYETPDTRVMVDSNGTQLHAVVTKLPFVRRRDAN